MSNRNKLDQAGVLTEQELNYLRNIEIVLELPKGKLIKAFIRDRMLSCMEAIDVLCKKGAIN